LVELKEDRFITGFAQTMAKRTQKVWHDRNTCNKTLKLESLVLLHDGGYLKNLRKLKIRWLEPFKTIEIIEVGTSKLAQLDGNPMEGLVNGSRLKSYHFPDTMR
jgi:hypothetical protein